jgi:membrane associated rhomboid family serine protease
MDIRSLLLTLPWSCWLYFAGVLILSDWRWNRGRIAQCIVLGILGVWIHQTKSTDAPWLWAVGALFVITIILPVWLHRRMRRDCLRGELLHARLIARLMGLITWTPMSRLAASVARMEAEVIDYAATPDALAAYGQRLFPILGARSLRQFTTARIDAHLALGQPSEAVELFERHFENGPLNAGSPLLYTAAIAHSERDDLASAIDLLKRAEKLRDPHAPPDLRRFLAFMRIYACAGHPEMVDAILENNGYLAAMLPAAYVSLWRSVALARAGEGEAARLELALSRARLTRNDAVFEQTLARRQAELDEPAPPVPSGIHSELAELSSAAMEAPEPLVASLHDPKRPTVTLSILGLIFAVFILTEYASSGHGARTLLLYGANAGGFVRAGQWWRLAASIFLHAGLLHFIANFYTCYIFGMFVERTTGRWGVFTTFIISGMAGSLASAFLSNHSLSVGASGAIFGLLGAAIVIALRMRGVFTAHMRRVYVFTFTFFAVVQLLFGLFETRIDNMAHAGGFLGGILCGVILFTGSERGEKKPLWRFLSFVSVAITISALVGVIYNISVGGYPSRPMPYRHIFATDDSWRISAPEIWQLTRVDDGTIELIDPILISVHIGSEYGGRMDVPFAGKGKNRVYLIRDQLFSEILRPGRSGPIRPIGKERRIFHTYAGDRHYYIIFTAERGFMAHYDAAIMRMLESFEPTVPGPWGRIPARRFYMP